MTGGAAPGLLAPGGVLGDILARKVDEVAAARAAAPLAMLEAAARAAAPARSLRAALTRPEGAPVRVLAEIKRASPSAGPIRAGADPVAIAREYDAGGPRRCRCSPIATSSTARWASSAGSATRSSCRSYVRTS